MRNRVPLQAGVFMLIKRAGDIPSSEITPKNLCLNRRKFLTGAAIAGAAAATGIGLREFTSLNDPSQMPGLRAPVLNWPYVEGLRMDEAMHPLALLCFGMYGEDLPNQDGAPLRIVVPWKYGFKSAKAIVRIRFVEKQPINSWNEATPNEYGFYSNVNPTVDHPRWSQAKERRLEIGRASCRERV